MREIPTMEPRSPTAPSRLKLEDLLLRHGAISSEQLEQAQQEQKKWGGEIGRILVDLGFISEQLLVRAVAHERNIPMADPVNDALSVDIVTTLAMKRRSKT
jgi:MSHA biogenesis protein MshE